MITRTSSVIGFVASATLLLFSACSQNAVMSTPKTGGAGAGAGAGGGAGQGGASGGAAGQAGGSAGAAAGVGGGGSGGSVAGSSGGSTTDAAVSSDADGAVTDAGATEANPDGPYVKPPSVPSTGCDKPATQALEKYVRHTVTNSTRVYDLRLPTGYDPKRVYPLVFLAHGCDGSIPYPMENATKGDAILVAPRSKDSQNSGQLYGGGCFDTMNMNSPEIPYFDQVLADVEGMTCVDKARVFFTGHSSGAWLSYLLGCARAGVIRATGNTAGGLPPGIPTCAGPIAEMGMHDMMDTLNDYPGGVKARDRILAINKCGTTTVPYDWDGDPKTASPCVMYGGCQSGFPVVWCATNGLGHSTQVPMSTVGLWRFWSQF
jgi:polyhydroxybutyrate depolymerase